jgi:hypothetical protein
MLKEAKNDFSSSAKRSLEQDQNRRGGDIIANMSNTERLANALKILQEDGLYQKEYTQFVESMSYADENERIGFEGAVQAFGRIIAIYKK